MKTNQPEGYYALAPGVEFITLKGKAVPIRGLMGNREGGFFYIGLTGYPVRRREMTHRETYQAARTVPITRPVVSGFDPADWG